MQDSRQKLSIRLALFLLVAVSLFLSACGRPPEQTTEQTTEQSVEIVAASKSSNFQVKGDNISLVEFYLDDTDFSDKPYSTDSQAPFELSLETSTLPDGEHNLSIQAKVGNKMVSASTTFTVSKGEVKPSPESEPTPEPQPETTPTPTPIIPAPAVTWTKIADEKTSFTLTETETVRFGADTRWTQKSVEAGTWQCHRNFFGGVDPADGVVKSCEVLTQGSAPAPTEPTPTEPTPTEPEPTDPTPTDPTPTDPTPTEPTEPDPVPTPTNSGEIVTVNYQKDNSNFLNPERGFTNPLASYSDNPKALESWRLEQTKASGISVINRRYVMVSFRNSAISQSYLDHIQADLNLVRQYGMKMVIRFSYTFNESGGNYADASLSRMLEHVEQLRPILQRNTDVIAYLEAGFIGRWGEWNKSSNGLGDETNPQNTSAQSQLVTALLGAMPSERIVTIRYIGRKKAIVSSNPLRADQAYNGSPQARTGHMNDYFTIDDWSGSDRTYLSQDTLYTVQGGEPIKTNGRRSECPATLGELTDYHWSIMNIPGSDFTSIWRNGGCYDSIQKRLGYRFFLSQARMPQTIAPGATLSVALTMSNEGFARPYNPRGLELVLRNRSNNQVTRLAINPGDDVRSFLPDPAESKNLTLNTVVPSNLASGNYDLFLNLPDGAASLNTRADYSIRLANTDMWDSATGYNKLGNLQVGANPDLLANAQ
jgi:Domain of unknown function (DUF4832)/Domain of unknown function (DUF4874)/Bacterial Ig domain